jgi:hypothetical protein
VKTPTPTMSATTMAVATSTETVEPLPGSRLGHAALPVLDDAISVYTPGHRAPDFFIVPTALCQFKQR